MDSTNNDIESCWLTKISNLSVIKDNIVIMQELEDRVYKKNDFLNRNLSPNCDINEECREKMCQWCYQVIDFCHFKRETVAISMSYLDRLLSDPLKYEIGLKALNSRREYQLTAITTLYLAVKLYEPIELEISHLADLSRGCYSQAEIAKMENEILFALDWRLHDPTIVTFVNHFAALLPRMVLDQPRIIKKIIHVSTFQAEIAVSDYYLSILNPSLVAFASILNVIDSINDKVFSSYEKQNYYNYIQNITTIDEGNQIINKVKQYLKTICEISAELEMKDLMRDIDIDQNELSCSATERDKISDNALNVCKSSLKRKIV